MMKQKNNILSAAIFLVSLVTISPMVYLLISSFKTRQEVNRPLSLPSSFYVNNYVDAWNLGRFPILFTNSIIVAVASIVLIIILTSIASYPLSRSRHIGHKIVYFYFLSGIMVPFQAGMIPLYKLIRDFGLINSAWALIMIYVGTHIPLSILIYTGFIKTVPREIEESAVIDGCGPVKLFYAIVFPLIKSATISVIILSIIPIWNDFLTPLIFITDGRKRTLPVGMYFFMNERVVNFAPIFAFGVLSCIPPIVLFICMQKYFYKGIVAGAVKG